MSTGFRDTIAHGKSERAGLGRASELPLSVELPLAVASEAADHIDNHNDLLVDVARALSYLQEVILCGSVRGADNELAAVVGLISTAVTAKQEKAAAPLLATESALRGAIAAAYQAEADQYKEVCHAD